MSLSPQAQTILEHLQTVGSISGVEANALYRCRHLPRRIKDIKEAGFNVVTEMRVDHTKQRYARYKLVAE